LDDFSEGIASLIQVINPSMIVFGGGLGMHVEYFKERLLKRLEDKLPNDIVNDLKIDKAIYGDDSALMGGCHLIFQDN
jgi:predicted NBD/HSP70 family sugar kinase